MLLLNYNSKENVAVEQKGILWGEIESTEQHSNEGTVNRVRTGPSQDVRAIFVPTNKRYKEKLVIPPQIT